MNEEINNSLVRLQTLLIQARTITKSLHGFQLPSRKHSFANILFARVFLQFYHFSEIGKNSQRQDENNIDYPIDMPSMASILRSIVELCRIFYYGAIERVSDDERDLRYLKFDLKSAYDKKRIWENFDSFITIENIEDDNIFGKIEEQMTILETEIKNHNYFYDLNDSQKKICLLRAKAMYLKEKEIEERAGLDKKHQDGMYTILSSEIHATPFALEQTVANVANTRSAQLTLNLLLTYAIDYLKMYIEGMIELFPELSP